MPSGLHRNRWPEETNTTTVGRQSKERKPLVGNSVCFSQNDDFICKGLFKHYGHVANRTARQTGVNIRFAVVKGYEKRKRTLSLWKPECRVLQAPIRGK